MQSPILPPPPENNGADCVLLMALSISEPLLSPEAAENWW